MLLITSGLLTLAHFIKKGEGTITFGNSFIIGIAQALAVIPGISRSGATIATGLLMKSRKNEVTRFSFLMVIIPILGAAFLDLSVYELSSEMEIGFIPLVIGFTAALISGLLACSWMVNIVRKGKLIYFAIYCFIVGLIAIFAS
jgi:undecaprenyl-diphosphatase